MEGRSRGKVEEPTRIELVIAVLQTAPLATWVRLPGRGRHGRRECPEPPGKAKAGRGAPGLCGQTAGISQAGDETRTRDIQLGKLAFYH